MNPTLTIVTPMFNGQDLLLDYEAAIAAVTPEAVIVIDNASDPYLRFTEPLTKSWRILVQDSNLGFTRACNLGLRKAETDAVLWLNSDIKLAGAATDWLAPIRGALRPGLLVGTELRADPHGDVDGRPHAYLDGWCLAGMRDDLIALGGFNEDFEEPAYYSDNELSFRAKQAEMRLVTVPTSLVHLRNRTSMVTNTRQEIYEVTMRNRERFAELVRKALGTPEDYDGPARFEDDPKAMRSLFGEATPVA